MAAVDAQARYVYCLAVAKFVVNDATKALRRAGVNHRAVLDLERMLAAVETFGAPGATFDLDEHAFRDALIAAVNRKEAAHA